MIIGMMMARNEANRWLNQSLETLKDICDKIIILDDGSTDNTVNICKNAGCEVILTPNRGEKWVENVQRARLWQQATKEAQDNDWIMAWDADQTIPKKHRLRLKYILQTQPVSVDGVGMVLFDMWSETEFRDDDLWSAHKRSWEFICRFKKDREYNWSDREHHCGCLPVGAITHAVHSGCAIQHWAYSTPMERLRKYAKYREIDPDCKWGIKAQYDSILDEAPHLQPFPKLNISVLIAAPVRARLETEVKIFKEYLKSLRSLNVPDDVEVHKLFILHESPALNDLLGPGEAALDADKVGVTEDVQYKRSERSHDFDDKSIRALTIMRNAILNVARNKGFDYVFQVDSDLILHPDTLKTLLESGKDIIAEIFWTKWEPKDYPKPQCWDFDAYAFYGDHWDGNQFLGYYRRKGTCLTGMTGACILISRAVFTAPNVNYNPIYNVSWTQFGEDRAFCTRVAMAGFQIWVNKDYPCRHLYRESDYQKYIAGEPADSPCFMDKIPEGMKAYKRSRMERALAALE